MKITLSEIDGVYKKNDKVKICIKDNNESFEVGTVKSVRRNFIYVVPMINLFFPMIIKYRI